MSTDLITYLRRYRPGMTREEVAVAAGVSIATLTRRLREGLDADEVMRAARAVGASPVEALIELSLLAPDDVRTVAATNALGTISERALLEELLTRAIDREDGDDADREDAGLPPSPPARFIPRSAPTDAVSDLSETVSLADAADDAAGASYEDEDEGRETEA